VPLAVGPLASEGAFPTVVRAAHRPGGLSRWIALAIRVCPNPVKSGKIKIRNSNLENRNQLESQTRQCRNAGGFGFWPFAIRICIGFRDSDFGLKSA
jgi:hypothetical protein